MLFRSPRRFAELPHRYDTLTQVSIPFVMVLALAQLLFFWNVVQTVRGKGGAATFDESGIPIARPQGPRGISTPVFEAALVLVALALAGAAGGVGYVIGHAGAGRGETKTVTVAPTTTSTTTTTTSAGGGGSAAAGAEIFAAGGCGACHTLAAAGATGGVGPALDGLPLTEALVVDRVTHGKGAMPSFATRLTAQQIADVAAYVVQSAS